MYMLLLLIGVLVSAAGFVTIGFGIPINAFSLGNTLIVAGTTAVAGGLVLIGLAMVVRQLARLAVILRDRPMASVKTQRPVEAAESLAPPTARIAPVPSPVPTRPSAPPRPPEAPMPRASFEPRFSAAASSDSPGPLDWMRPKSKTPNMMDSPVVEVADEAPLSPRTPQRPLFSPPPLSPASATEPFDSKSFESKPFESKSWLPPGRSDTTETKPAAAPVSRSEQIARAAPAIDEPSEAEHGKDESKETGLFDVVWPDVRARAGSPAGETIQREVKPEVAPPRRREQPVAEKRTDEGRADITSADRPSAILKSGVIDGMGYTLYADGSIEAELPQGTVKFASVDALRAHLEKSA